MAEQYTQSDMLKNIWPHPVEDSDGDNVITLKEKAWYVLKMIPWSLMAMLVPTLKWAMQDGIKAMMPLAVAFVKEAALSALPGNGKYTVVRDRLTSAAAEKGVELATRDINRLIENALAVYDEETAAK